MAATYKRVKDGGLAPRSDAALALGAQFKRIRELHGVTLADIRSRTGFAINTIRAHEAGSLPFRADDLMKVARAIGVRPGVLFYRREGEAFHE